VSNMFYILGASLAQAIGEDETLCRGVLRMSIMNSVQHLRQITDPVKSTTETTAYIPMMVYRDWETIISGPAFSQTLTNIGIKETSTIRARLMQTLVEQQSLFTMSAR
jgi:hypothetical protein